MVSHHITTGPFQTTNPPLSMRPRCCSIIFELRVRVCWVVRPLFQVAA